MIWTDETALYDVLVSRSLPLSEDEQVFNHEIDDSGNAHCKKIAQHDIPAGESSDQLKHAEP